MTNCCLDRRRARTYIRLSPQSSFGRVVESLKSFCLFFLTRKKKCQKAFWERKKKKTARSVTLVFLLLAYQKSLAGLGSISRIENSRIAELGLHKRRQGWRRQTELWRRIHQPAAAVIAVGCHHLLQEQSGGVEVQRIQLAGGSYCGCSEHSES